MGARPDQDGSFASRGSHHLSPTTMPDPFIAASGQTRTPNVRPLDDLLAPDARSSDERLPFAQGGQGVAWCGQVPLGPAQTLNTTGSARPDSAPEISSASETGYTSAAVSSVTSASPAILATSPDSSNHPSSLASPGNLDAMSRAPRLCRVGLASLRTVCPRCLESRV